jgi:tetratricopeptide (TPR) repeat protein
MRAVNWFEDYSGELSEMPPTDSALFVDFGHFFNNINKFPDGVSEILKNVSPSGSSIISIIDNTHFDKRQTVKYLKKMIETGVLTIEKKETPVSIPPRPAWLSQAAEEEKESKEVKDPGYLSEASISPFNDLDLSESEKIPEEENTLVPPPSFAKKDTLDPALDIKFDIEPQDEAVHNSININIDILEGNYLEDKTEIVKSVHPEGVSAATSEDIKKHLSESDTPKKSYFKIILLFLFAGAVLAVHMYFPEKLRGLTSFLVESFNRISGSEEVALAESQAVESKEKIPQKGRDVVLTENQQKLTGYSVSDLILMSAKYFEEENYQDAVDANKVALYKLKVEKIAKGAEYEKVMTNMAIFLYTHGKYEEALEFAEESILLRDDEKGVELKAAILEELKRPAAAASLFRTKLNDEKFAHKKEEWMIEINRLENIIK